MRLRLFFFYLDGFSLDLHRLLPEVHADRGLGLVGESAPGEAERQAGLPDVGVPDDDDLEDARLDAQLLGGPGGAAAAAAGSAPNGFVKIHGSQDGHVVLCSVPAFFVGEFVGHFYRRKRCAVRRAHEQEEKSWMTDGWVRGREEEESK